MTSARRTQISAALAVMLSGALAGNAVAQTRSSMPWPRSFGRTLLHRQNGGYSTGLSGVKAQLPRPIANRGSLLPPPPPAHGHGSGGPVMRSPFDMRNWRGFDQNRRGPVAGGDAFNGFITTGNGVSINGSFTDDNFRLRFGLNPGAVYPLRGGRHHGHDGHGRGFGNTWPWPAYNYWPYADLWGYWNWYDRNDYESPLVVNTPVYIDPSMLGTQPQVPATPPPALTSLEKGDQALAEGRVRDAVREYRDHLQNYADDAAAMRSLAVALVQDKKVKEGVAVMSLAYDKDLSLVRRPLDPEMVAGGADEFRNVLVMTVHFANRMKSASGYLTVAVMLQAEGREDLALKSLEKAKAAGLDEKLAAELQAELSR